MMKYIRKIYTSHRLLKLYDIYEKAWLDLTLGDGIGMNMYSQDWDLMIILDTCRVDALKQLSSEYSYLNDISSIWSVGSSTPEWTINTFNKNNLEEINKTAYIVSSGYAGYVIRDRIFHPNKDIEFKEQWGVATPSDFKYYEESWDAGNQVQGYPIPDNTTQRAVDVYRNVNPDRMVVHYFSPHSPFTYREIRGEGSMREFEKNPFEILRNGEGEIEEIWESYLDQLRVVLDSLKSLLNNVDAEKVIISADHGEAFGEMGLFEHRAGMIHPVVKKVPWAVTTATDNQTLIPHVEKSSQRSREKTEVEDNLKHLGYI